MESNKLSNEELNRLQSETYEHLWNGRYRMALNSAKTLFKSRPDDSEAAICLAWSLLENNSPTKAMEYANLAVELKGDQIKAKLYRGYILMRMSIFEGAIQDFNSSVDKQKETLSWTYINKARALAGMFRFSEALKSYELALIIDGGKNPEWQKSKVLYEVAKKIFNDDYSLKEKEAKELLKNCELALKVKENWFVLCSARKVNENKALSSFHDSAFLLEMEAMMNLFQYRPAMKKAEEQKKKFKRDKKFGDLYKALQKYMKNDVDDDQSDLENYLKEETPDKIEVNHKDILPQPKKENSNGARHDLIAYPNDNADIVSIKMFDVVEDSEKGIKRYYQAFDRSFLKHAGAEIIFNNPLYEKQNNELKGEAVWYTNDYVVGRNKFQLKVDKNWDTVIFAQTWGSDERDYWKEGQSKIEIYIDGLKIAEKYFGVGAKDVLEPTKEKDVSPLQSEKTKEKETEKSVKIHEEEQQQTLEELLEELNGYIGLNSIKTSIGDFIDYLEYLEHRKKEGLKSDDHVSLNCAFVGNPGTGKTTIARLFGKIFRAMGILTRGHVIEVDRSALVGQYVGETAQKTEKIIEDAKGGVLFVDEAYTLVKKGGSGQDFGQEAVDVLLKRMEDMRGEFIVIVAGYTDEMETFMSSNPGLKSRFNRTFIFEDYSPDELLEIFDMLIKKADYLIDEEAKDLLKKEFMTLYRARDKTFGNARLVRQFFEEAKMNLSKRYLNLSDVEQTKDAMMTINLEDIQGVLTPDSEKSFMIPVDEEKLSESLIELDTLIGLESVKKDMRDLVKLVRYYIEQGEDVKSKYSSHILFLGNPGTGKTTVARILSKIYSALGLLPKGHLVEVDRQQLVASFVGQTAEKTTAVINSAIGGTLFIDEAYSLVKSDGGGSDFGKEAIDTLLKRMEDDRGKFIVIAAGYTEEMKGFIESNPGIQSRFTKSFTFEDYTPDEMMEITKKIIDSRKVELEENAEMELMKYYTDLYRNRDKNFGNARLVRNTLETAQHQMVLRIAGLSKEERENLKNNSLSSADLVTIINVKSEAKQYEVVINEERLQENLNELYKLAGQDNVKDEVKKLINSLKVAKLRKARGLKVVNKSLHSVFMGNPGTGKTTVARLLSNIYKELGVIEKGHLVEVDRADLVAGYQGQTAIKTDEIINKAMGGTLFIDEAYTLARGANDFGQEAIDTLLKRMEDHKDSFVVIVAGYTNEMKTFVDSNPGLQSRFSNFFTFEDYEPRQLLSIANDISISSGYKLDEGALQLLLEYFTSLYEKRDNNFGNARTAKNVLYKAISNQEVRISQLIDHTDEDLMTIVWDDVHLLFNND
ncbi:MAG: AAA family ATPase [Bacteroidetes bacterium]|nr:AAA family ATPase [Bacteroidota bacterium]